MHGPELSRANEQGADAAARGCHLCGDHRGRGVRVSWHRCVAVAARTQANTYAICVVNRRYANYMQLDVASPAAVTASTTGIAVVQSVVELSASAAVSLVRFGPCPDSTCRTCRPDALLAVFSAYRTPPQHARLTAAPQTRRLERVTHNYRLMVSRLRDRWLR